jgi:ABC-type transport system substrate-binding protein
VQDTAKAKEILGRTATLEIMLVDEEHDLASALSGYVPGLPPFEQDVGAARALLQSSRFPQGFAEALFFTERDSKVASLIVSQAAAVGIRFEPKEVAWEELDRLMTARRTRAYLFVMTFPSADATDLLLTGFHTPSTDRRYGLLNFSAYSDREMDRLIEDSDRDLNYSRRLGLLQRAMQKALAADAWLPLCVPDTLFAARKGLAWRAGASGRLDLREITESSE